MDISGEFTTAQAPRITTGAVVLGAGSIVLAWAIGICGTMAEFSITGPLLLVPRDLIQALRLPYQATLLILPGALVLMGILVVCHSAIILPCLPRAAWGGWVAATLLGAALSWLLAWAIFFSQGQAWWRVDPASAATRDLAAFVYFTAIALIGGISGGLVLGGLQWLVLRRYVARAGWWILATIIGTTVLITMFAM